MALRWEVFVCEQAVPMILEIDARDLDPKVMHLNAVSGEGKTLGVVRIIPDQPGHYHLGRLAVRRDDRNRGIGKTLVEAAHEYVSAHTLRGHTATVILDAQIHARGFYEAIGYNATTENTFFDAGIEHIEMAIVLKGAATG